MEASQVVITAATKTNVVNTELLVSVRNASETTAAIAGGANWIDLKEPRAGALGAVDFEIAAEVARLVGNLRPLSAALGELQTWKNTSATQLLEVPEISYVKLGLSSCSNVSDWKSMWKQTDAEISAAGKSLVAVAYADWRIADAPTPEEIISLAAESSAKCLLIDTFDKSAGGTLDCLKADELQQILQQAKSQGLKLVLAGKLSLENILFLPLEQTDLVAVRGAACPAGRDSLVDRILVAKLKAAIDAREQMMC